MALSVGVIYLAGLAVQTVGLVLHIVGLATPEWSVIDVWNGVDVYGLWRHCTEGPCVEWENRFKPTALIIAEAFSIVGMTLGCVALVFAVLYIVLPAVGKNGRHIAYPIVSLCLDFLALLSILACVIVYSLGFDQLYLHDTHLGYSYGLSITGGILLAIGGGLVFFGKAGSVSYEVEGEREVRELRETGQGQRDGGGIGRQGGPRQIDGGGREEQGGPGLMYVEQGQMGQETGEGGQVWSYGGQDLGEGEGGMRVEEHRQGQEEGQREVTEGDQEVRCNVEPGQIDEGQLEGEREEEGETAVQHELGEKGARGGGGWSDGERLLEKEGGEELGGAEGGEGRRGGMDE